MTISKPSPKEETSMMRNTRQHGFRTWSHWMTMTIITISSLRTCSKRIGMSYRRKSACVRSRPGRDRWNLTSNLRMRKNPKRKSGGASSTNSIVSRSSQRRKNQSFRKPGRRLYLKMRTINSKILTSTTREMRICRNTSVRCSTNSQQMAWQTPSSSANMNN